MKGFSSICQQLKKAIRKPKVGDAVVFELGKDSQDRLKATHVLLEGVSLENPGVPRKIITEHVKKDALDYFIYFILAASLTISLGSFVKIGTPESAMVPGAMFLAALLFLFNRKKQPASKLFSCSKCHSISSHDKRTVLAWNRGFNALYCKSCHQAWLREQPKELAESRSSYPSSKSGCLGLFLVIVSFPAICVIGAIKWITQA